ncbi:MAG: phosphoribosylanthranilate isomerase [Ardenticatenaceae bacterium]
MSIKVKICGNTSLEDARVAAEAGADMLGFIFYEPSRRNIAPEKAGEIVATLRAELGDAAPVMVGVFVDEPMARVRELRESLGLDLAQLHGSEPPVEMRVLGSFAFKAIRPQNRGDAEALVATYGDVLPQHPDAPDFLLDAYHPWMIGGTGYKSDWHSGKTLATRFKVMLAGGLSVENVAEAIHVVQPWGVDVASGVEASKGVKDHERVRAFIREAKRAP